MSQEFYENSLQSQQAQAACQEHANASRAKAVMPNCPRCGEHETVESSANQDKGSHYCYRSRGGCGDWFTPQAPYQLHEESLLDKMFPAIDIRKPETFSSVIDHTLAERGKRYGSLEANAIVSQNIKEVMRRAPNWDSLSRDKREALDQIASKISRILVGDSTYSDNWHDIIGYAKLVEDSLAAL